MLSTAMKQTDKKSLEVVVAEFRRGMAHHRRQGVSDERIRRILGEAIHRAFEVVKDPEQRAWLCEEFEKAARVASPILASHAASRLLH